MKSRRPSSHTSQVRLVAGWIVAGLLGAALTAGKPIDYDTPAWKEEIAHGYLPYHQLARPRAVERDGQYADNEPLREQMRAASL